MATCNVNSLTSSAGCFFCVPPGYWYPLKLALLCQIAQKINPAIDCSVNALLANAKCFACLTEAGPLKIQLLCNILAALGGGGGGVIPVTPTNLDVTIGSTNGNTVLTWSQTVAPTNNLVERSINGAAYIEIAVLAGSATSYIDAAALANGDVWRYRVRGENGINMGAYSNIVAVSNNLTFDGTAMPVIAIPELIMAYGDFIIRNEPNVTTLSFPLLKKVIGGMDFRNDFAVTTIAFASLQTAGTVTMNFCTALASISFPVFASSTNSFEGSGCTSLPSISLPALTSVGLNFIFSACTALVSVSVPVLVHVAGNIMDFSGSTILTTLTMPNGIFPDGITIDFTNDALNAASVNLILHRGVVSGDTVCTFNLAGGTNAAPSGAGVADKLTLQLAGNTVNTN